MKVKAFVLRPQVFSSHRTRLWFSESNIFEKTITTASILLTLLSIERHVSTILKSACWVLWVLRKLASILNVWVQKMNWSDYKSIFKYFLRNGFNRCIVTFVCSISFLKSGCNISILYNIRKISTFYTIVEKFCERVRIYMNRVGHDSSCNVLKMLVLFVGSSLMIFIISSCWNSRKINFLAT